MSGSGNFHIKRDAEGRIVDIIEETGMPPKHEHHTKDSNGRADDSPEGGVDQAHHAESDPTNAWGFVYRIVKDFGVLAGVVVAMGIYIYMIENWHREDTAKAHTEFSELLKANTDALKELGAQQKTSNDHLVELNTTLVRHLDDDHHHH